MTIHTGCRAVEVFDPIQKARIPTWLLYPTREQARAERFGPYSFDAAMNASIDGERLPLVVISHGNAGSPWAYRDLAAGLVREGFVVAAVEHTGNSRNDNSLSDAQGVTKVANLQNRPRHIRLAIDAALADERVGPRLVPGVAAVVGHSIGGYTALAAAGGHARTVPDEVDHARRLAMDEATRKLAFPVETEADARVRAVVLLAPALGFFLADGALADVRVPVLVRTGERDTLCPTEQVKLSLRSLPDASRVDVAEVPGAGHFAFLSPFPPEMTGPHVPASQDPPGFDRVRYGKTLLAEIVTFLRASLASVA